MATRKKTTRKKATRKKTTRKKATRKKTTKRTPRKKMAKQNAAKLLKAADRELTALAKRIDKQIDRMGKEMRKAGTPGSPRGREEAAWGAFEARQAAGQGLRRFEQVPAAEQEGFVEDAREARALGEAEARAQEEGGQEEGRREEAGTCEEESDPEEEVGLGAAEGLHATMRKRWPLRGHRFLKESRWNGRSVAVSLSDLDDGLSNASVEFAQVRERARLNAIPGLAEAAALDDAQQYHLLVVFDGHSHPRFVPVRTRRRSGPASGSRRPTDYRHGERRVRRRRSSSTGRLRSSGRAREPVFARVRRSPAR